MDSLYKTRKSSERFRQTLLSFCKSATSIRLRSGRIDPSSEDLKKIVTITKPSNTTARHVRYTVDKEFGEQEMLRDLFFWSVYAGNIDIAFVLLLQLKSRMGAALIAAGIAERLSSGASNLNIRNTYNEHRTAYEEYAGACVNACYRHNERFACQLLLREIPLFGNITCMQVS